MQSKVRIGINGFGRIGKMAFKLAIEKFSDKVEVVGINDLNTTQQAAQVLKYDSVYGKFNHDISFTDTALVVDGIEYPKFAEKEPEKLPWGKLNVDVVLECTGVFTKKEAASRHLASGAKTVIISAPAKGEDHVGTYVIGVNDDKHNSAQEPIISNASCTTNCITPVMKVLEDSFGIEKAMMSTIHAYTADQVLVDGNHKDPRRARSAGLNIVPTTTGAAIATSEAIPSLKGVFDGLSFRVPVPVGSLSDMTVLLKKNVTKEEVNNALIAASQTPRMKGVLEVTNEPVVSSDIVGNPASSIVDLALTTVVGGNLVKVVAWYDNEFGYSNRLIEQAIEVGR
ncbi:MAG: type I glyceraldehyde-3-phosphate dehydrogenase [Candidatus Kerfeldbacteria bacterium]|nr:type I glyceraldehyde-3-phosphate dehydrogenase [Candidatus Kerfeldbacteria bacterium]